MSEGEVHYELRGASAYITFDRPQHRNAMTWKMYQELHQHTIEIKKNIAIRCVVLRGTRRESFVAGTDIKQFREFTSAQDGIDYEKNAEIIIAAVESMPIPTIAAVDQWAIGGGLAIAGVCDIRVATPGSKFGIPIARTLGNTLSNKNYKRLIDGFGTARVKRMLMLSELLDADEALACGFLKEIIPPESMDERVDELIQRLIENAPLSIRAGKESIRRLLHNEMAEVDDDLIASCYGSHDFKLGIEAFINKKKAKWTGF
jgi:enoyl-CoA hydratase/carnithine racemase